MKLTIKQMKELVLLVDFAEQEMYWRTVEAISEGGYEEEDEKFDITVAEKWSAKLHEAIRKEENKKLSRG